MKIIKPYTQIRTWIARITLIVIAGAVSFFTFAQEKDVDINLNTYNSGSWNTAPWVWVVGAAVFILLLIAILRGGGSRKTEL